MTIPVSTAPAVRDYLLTQLTAAIAPDPLDKSASLIVCMDDPGTYQPGDVVVIGDVTNEFGTNSLVGSGGAGWLEERYRVTIDIEVWRGTDDASAVSRRAYLLAGVICNVVRADPGMGGLVLISRPATANYTGTVPEDHFGRLGQLSLEIECFQRI